MGLTTLILLALLATAAGAWALRAHRDRPTTRSPRDGVQVRRVRVAEGYDPPDIHVQAGVPIRLIFHREETFPCSEHVVFPDYGISAGLPPFQDVPIDLPASEPGAHRFCCEMDMLHGSLIVDPNRQAAHPDNSQAAAR